MNIDMRRCRKDIANVAKSDVLAEIDKLVAKETEIFHDKIQVCQIRSFQSRCSQMQD